MDVSCSENLGWYAWETTPRPTEQQAALCILNRSELGGLGEIDDFDPLIHARGEIGERTELSDEARIFG